MKATANETNSFAIPPFEFPKMALPELGEIAERGLARAQEGCEKMKSASEAVTDTLRQTYSSNASGATDYGLKVIEISSANTTSAIDFFAELLGSKSMTDVLAVSAAQARRAFETTSAQNKELWELAQKVANQTSEPIRRHVANVLQQAK
ncbi:MAG: phasin family protein [Bradyrhizobium sp.]|uniref:phasin family protein n=1 Tax=Bradyrhizobium sp. TaxID=376 RepID=UPI0025C41778|nr:phasin family protein [Bradyrhizobium sp.]MBI5260390.1 phasin family protein [Bradyrhizobium sp.]